MGALSEFGKLGLTAIGDSHQQAEDLYNQVVQVLDRETSCDEEVVEGMSGDSCYQHSCPSLPIAWQMS
jgi:hypothetical protein